MVDKKISELTAAGALDGTELAAIVQAGTTKKQALSAFVLTTGASTITGPKTFDVAAAGAPLKILGPNPQAAGDLFQVIGSDRVPGTPSIGKYRVIVDTNIGITMNTALTISTGTWTGTGQVTAPVLAQGRPYCIGVDSDVVGPTLWLRGNGDSGSSHVEIQDQPGNKVIEIRQPAGVASGAWMSIGEEAPIATLTLSDKYEEPAGGGVVSFVMRHGRGTGSPASIRFKLPSTGDLDISANSESGENALSEWAIRLGHGTQGVSFQTATAPGGTRTEIGRFVSNGLLLNGPVATSGAPDQSSLTLTLKSQYWNGSASTGRGFRVRDVALGGSPHTLQFIVDETNLVGFAIGNTGQVGVGDAFAANLAAGQLHVAAAATTTPALVTDTATSSTADIQKWRISSTEVFAIDPAGLPKWTASGNQQTTVGAAGGASALPATPTKYLKIKDSAGTTLVIPAYAA